MRLETLDDALCRVEAGSKPLSARAQLLRSALDGHERAHKRYMDAPRAEAREAYLMNAASLFDARAEFLRLQEELQAAHDLERTLRYIRCDWKVAMPGCGTFVASFFVRSYRIEGGKPAAYDPFWIESCVLRGEEYDGLMARHATWASGGELRPGGSGPSNPLLPVRVPFGPAEEAARAPCGTCGVSGHVIGYKEFVHWTEDDDVQYRQSLKLLCLACPRIALLAERSDPKPVRLNP